MPKNKRPVPRKSHPSPEEKSDAIVQRLCDLAIELVEQEDIEQSSEALQENEREYYRTIKKCLYQKKDEILYEAIARASYVDDNTWQFLKDSIETASQTILLHHQDSEVAMNAFVIPLFAHTKGGLKRAHCFQDQDAFDLLTESIKQAQLESPDAKVVLISHAYHPDEIDAITYSHLNEMVMNAFSAMTDRKVTQTPAIDRSFFGWPETAFAPEDPVIELRFLVGFTLTKADDPFYEAPEDEDEADAYYARREERFQHWAEQVAPLVKRCLAQDDSVQDVNFMYQDLFFNGKENGIAEHAMLQMLSELQHGLDQHAATPADAHAIVGLAGSDDDPVLRVQLFGQGDGTLIAAADKPLGAAHDLALEIAETYDALMAIGVQSMALASRFDTDGKPVDVVPYEEPDPS